MLAFVLRVAFQIALALALSLAGLLVVKLTLYIFVATCTFVTVIGVFVNNERRFDTSSTSDIKLPEHHIKRIDLATQLGLAVLCGAFWPSLAIFVWIVRPLSEPAGDE